MTDPQTPPPLTVTLVVGAPKFPLGRLLATPGALRAVSAEQVAELVTRHAQGDWGVAPPEDKLENERALLDGDRLMSSYEILGEREDGSEALVTIWIITEADRASTTVLLPEDY